MMTNDEIIAVLKRNDVFQKLSEQQYSQVLPFVKALCFNSNEYFIKQDEVMQDVFIIVEGSVTILKKDDLGNEHCIRELSAGEMIGELAFIDHNPRSASVKTTSKTTLLKIDIAAIEKNIQDKTIYTLLYRNLAQHFSVRLRDTNEVTVKALKSDLERAKRQVGMSNLMVTSIVILTFFTLSLSVIYSLALKPSETTAITLPLLMLTMFAVSISIKKTGYPLDFYGITLKNAGRVLLESIAYTIPILIISTLLKWIAIQTIPSFSHVPVFAMPLASAPTYIILLSLAYLLLSAPIQEVIFRGTLQASLQEFLISKHNVWLAIFVSNLLFAVIHVAVSFLLVGFTFLLGLYWGWMYHKQRSILGVSLSHMLVGGWAFFVLGIQHLVTKL